MIISVLKPVRKNKSVILALLYSAVVVDIFFIKENYDLVLFGLLIIYIFSTFIFKLKSKTTFIICLFLLLIMYVYFLLTGTSNATEKAAVWLFFFLGIGIWQQWRE